METIQGNERLFGAEDVFFSTTDLKGVIRNANQTFLTLARHPREEMIGAPHNIIRHDDMPAGVFKLMWDDIQAGRPVCAYVLNRAGDGRDYWVFATVTAIEDGYVSVRTKPLDDGTFAAVREVYGRVRAIEREAAEQGVPRRQVAEKGAEVLLAELAALGFPSLSAFSVASLPTEAVLLIDEGVRVPVRHGMEGPAATILGCARDIERDSDTLVGQMGGYRSLLDGLGAWMEEAPAIIERARRTGELVSMFDSQDPESSVPAVAARVAERTAHAVEQLTGLTETVSSLYRAVQELSFRASLMRLHTLVLGSYAAAVVDGTEEDVPAAMTELHRALAADLAAVGAACADLGARRDELDGAMRLVVSDLDRTRRPFGRWLRALQGEYASLREGKEGDILALLGEAERLSDAGFPEMSSLAALAARCRGLDLSYNADAMDGASMSVSSAIAELGMRAASIPGGVC
ncbi:PAS domain-containing protein [Actinomyces israelii]|uniref:PAS domain-containing protein n=1 Tax=Actinomyces israelii TaxID=1659 RepID=UPI00069487CC|nr:PAS domain-containing protein [Actinomyces israelii]